MSRLFWNPQMKRQENTFSFNRNQNKPEYAKRIRFTQLFLFQNNTD